jgi:hypothetical protein
MDDETTGGSDIGRDHSRDWGDAPAPAYRDAPPDHPFVPIDPDAPVSGHQTEFPEPPLASLSPEHDWSAAAGLIFPLLRPVGAAGLHVTNVDPAELLATSRQSHAQPIVDDGPCGTSVVYAMKASGFDVIVNGDHLLSWGIGPEAIQDAAIANLAAWSAGTPWTAETSAERKLLSSDSGLGWDASRILLPEVRAHIGATLGDAGRILVGLPERHLLVAGSMLPGDEEFGALFAEFVIEQSGGADEPIDRRVFELVDGQLIDFVS